MKKTLTSLLLAHTLWLFGQQDSIIIKGNFSESSRKLSIQQKVVYQNKTSQPLENIELLNWIAAYKPKNTALAHRLLENRNSDLYFSEKHERGLLVDFSAQAENKILHVEGALTDENLILQLPHPLAPGESFTFNLEYTLRLPHNRFTRYGAQPGKTFLKYFFVVPKNPEIEGKFLDIGDQTSPQTFWDVSIDAPKDFKAFGNLNTFDEQRLIGTLNATPEIFLVDEDLTTFKTQLEQQNISITFEKPISEEDKSLLEFYLPLQLRFLKNKLGELPSHFLVSDKFFQENKFKGASDLSFWKFRFPLFSRAQQLDLNYFSVLSAKAIEELYISNKQENHWFTNGIQTYLEMQYLKSFYKDSKLLGELPENFKILGLKPLKIFHVSKLKLIDRYSLAYQYIRSQNLDQKITSRYSELSRFNETAISHFEAGVLFNYTAEKMGEARFEQLLKDYLLSRKNKNIDGTDFLNILTQNETSSAYISNFIQHKNRINFKLKSFDKIGDDFEVKLTKNTDLPLPVKLETETKDGYKKNYWFEMLEGQHDQTFRIPDGDAHKIIINDDYLFPETNFRDNYIYTSGLFSNMKKLKLKLFKDVPNPEYNEIYVTPKFSFNVYDKFLVGLNFKNVSFFDRPFTYSLTPYYSTGTGELAGSTSLSYHIMPAESFFRKLSFLVSGTYLHYDYDLAYRKITATANMDFAKPPRSTIQRSFAIGYNYYQKDLSPAMIAENEYDKYHLWTARYAYSDNQMILEKSMVIGSQYMEDFSKISAEAFYRWEYAQNKKISFRWFGGLFLHNKTRNHTFDYGISKVSDYSFSYGLLGQSATTGLFSQQYVLAEGGMKSLFPKTVNNWLTTVGVDAHIWKMFNVYADAGVFKNKYEKADFVWDSGVKVKIIPDFIEVYFPIQSSLGFEPGFKDYAQRIRFTFVFSLGAILNQARRGLY